MSEETRIFPRSSAFEALLAKVYLELWDLQDNPAAFTNRVEKFARVWLPSMFQTKVAEKLGPEGEFNEKMDKLEAEINRLEQAEAHTDPFTAETIAKGSIPAEEADFAGDIWHAIIDVLTEAGFNFPIARRVERRKMEM